MSEWIDWKGDRDDWLDYRPGDKHLRYWQQRLNGVQSYVYAIQGYPATPVKFGVATDVRKRIAGLQTGSWQPLRLLFVVPGDRELEAELHARMLASDRACRAYGEWFYGEPVTDTLALMVSLADQMKSAYDGSGVAPGFTDFPPFDIASTESGP